MKYLMYYEWLYIRSTCIQYLVYSTVIIHCQVFLTKTTQLLVNFCENKRTIEAKWLQHNTTSVPIKNGVNFYYWYGILYGWATCNTYFMSKHVQNSQKFVTLQTSCTIFLFFFFCGTCLGFLFLVVIDQLKIKI